MRNPLAAHPPWRQLTIIALVVPLLIVLAVLAFAWPAARIAPRHLPVGIVGTGPASQQVRAGLTRSDPGGFDVHLYADEASARSAIEDRDVYGAFAVACPAAARASCWPTVLSNWATSGLAALASRTVMPSAPGTNAP